MHFAPSRRLYSVPLSSRTWAIWRRPQRLPVCPHLSSGLCWRELSPSTRSYAGMFLSRIYYKPNTLTPRLNVHLLSIVASKPFQMPVEVLPRAAYS